MANKTLSQVVGAGGVEIGDIIKTRATSLTDGKVLLDCDGSTLTPASYPQLEALFNTGKAYSFPAPYISSNGTSMDSNVAINYGQIAGVSDDGSKIIAMDDDDDLWWQDASGAAEVAAFVGGMGNACMSADGQEAIAAFGGQGGTNDLIAHYTTSGGSPSSTVNIETTDVMQNSAWCAINAAGTSALVMAYNNTDGSIDTYISGANIGTGYTLANADTTISGIPTQQIHDISWTDDLQAVAILDVSSGGGIWITTDQGANWTEDLQPPGPTPAVKIALDQTDNLYVITSKYDVIWKTADAGSTWTEFLTVHDIAPYLDFAGLGLTVVAFSDMKVDSNNNWYVFISSSNGGDASNAQMMHRLGLLYSGDQGTNWAYSDLAVAIGNVQSADHWVFSSTTQTGFRISQSGTSIICLASIGTAPIMRRWTGGATGKVLPLIPGHKIVADAP